MYKSLYLYELLDTMKEGKRVYVLDRLECDVQCVNDLYVNTFIQYLNCAEKENGRFEFWTIEKSEAVEA